MANFFLGIILNKILWYCFVECVALICFVVDFSRDEDRVLGFNKLGIVFIVLNQTLSYVTPAIVAGNT